MSEEHSDPRAQEDADAAQPEPSPSAAAPDPVRQPSASRLVASWLGAFLMLTVAGVALSPFWAPVLAPLLPWGASPAGGDYDALSARVAAIEQRPPPGADAQVNSALAALGRRVEQLEGAPGARAGSPGGVLDAIKAAQNEQAHRLDALEAGRRESRQTEATAAAGQADLQKVEQRLTALEALSSARTAGDAADLQNIKQQLSRVDSASADITKRISAVEQQVRSDSGVGQTEAALAIVLLQMREAVDRGRPFPAEYGSFKMLAANAHLAGDAAPLAEASQSGVASRIVLSKRLAELADNIGGAEEPPAEAGWGARTLARLRGLVTIRRIDGVSQSGPEAAVSRAQAALSRGDLADAVAALEALGGASAEAARPWLRMAQQRIAVEAALDHLQQSLEATLGRTRAAPDAPPADSPTKTRTPS